MEVLIGSLERKLQRPLLAKSRTLPSIPQSPTVSRAHRADLVGGSPSRGKPLFSTSHPKACTLPPAGEAWRLEDDNDEEGGEAEAGRPRAESRPRSQSPFSQLRSRAAYLRKSASVDDHLGSSEFGTAPAETKGHRTGKGKLKRKFGPFLPHIVGVGWRLQLVRNVFVPATSHRTGAERPGGQRIRRGTSSASCRRPSPRCCPAQTGQLCADCLAKVHKRHGGVFQKTRFEVFCDVFTPRRCVATSRAPGPRRYFLSRPWPTRWSPRQPPL